MTAQGNKLVTSIVQPVGKFVTFTNLKHGSRLITHQHWTLYAENLSTRRVRDIDLLPLRSSLLLYVAMFE